MDNFANQHKLEEGELYTFRILKHLNFEGEQFYILETPLKNRITIPAEPYKKYQLKIGEELRCKVDKISCSGKMYLEPEHPFYKVGETYWFDIVEIKTIKSLYSGFIKMIYCKDKLDNLIEIPVTSEFDETQTQIELSVLRIKKAHVTAYPNQSPFNILYKNQEELQLRFFQKYINQFDEAMYLTEDQKGGWHIIPAKYFPAIDIEQYAVINAVAVKHKTIDYFYIEPEHPIYKTGKIYPFVVIDVDVNSSNIDENNIKEVNITLKDSIFEGYHLRGFFKNCPQRGDEVLLITLGIRKGVLRLEFPK